MNIFQYIVIVGFADLDAKEEVLGLTWSALMLWLGGALGGFARALQSETQKTFSRRTFYDVLVGGFTGLVIPIVAQRIPLLSLDISKLTALDKAAIAFLVGAFGSLIWTSRGWRLGWIVPSKMSDKDPREGVLKNDKNASRRDD